MPGSGHAKLPSKILIVRLSSLGDVIHTLPVLSALRRHWPDAHIAWAVEAMFKDLLVNNPDLDEVIEVHTQHWRRAWNPKSFFDILGMAQSIRRKQFDLVLDMQGLLKSGLVTWLSGAKKRIGFHRKDCRESFSANFTNIHAARTNSIHHIVDKNLSLLNKLGIDPAPVKFPIHIPDDAVAFASHWLKEQPKLAGHSFSVIHPGVGYETKAWPLERFAQLADRMQKELNQPVVIAWGPGLNAHRQRIASAMQTETLLGPETPSLFHAMALYKEARQFIGGDTGPLHLCAGMGIPVIALHGPTDPRRNGPYGSIHEVVETPQPCSYCFKRTCPTNNECMSAVTVDQVFSAVKYNLTQPAPAGVA